MKTIRNEDGSKIRKVPSEEYKRQKISIYELDEIIEDELDIENEGPYEY